MDRRADDGQPVSDSQLWTAFAFGHQQSLHDAIEPAIAVARESLAHNPHSKSARRMLQSALATRAALEQEIERLLVKAACAERIEAEHDLH